MNAYGLKVGTISGVRPLEVAPSGRPVKMAIVSDSGRTELKSNDFRLKIGAEQLRSTLFRLHEAGDGIVVRGRGFGHGVGMSQWGAYRMARKGHDYRDILKYYYRGIEIARLKGSG